MTLTVTKIGYGISIGHATTQGGSYTSFAEVLNLTPPGQTVDKVKVARSDNSVPVVEQVPGWIETGDAEFEITYAAGGGAAIKALLGVQLWFKITYPLCGSQSSAGDTEVFPGFIDDFARETPLKDAMKSKIKIAGAGDVIFAAGS